MNKVSVVLSTSRLLLHSFILAFITPRGISSTLRPPSQRRTTSLESIKHLSGATVKFGPSGSLRTFSEPPPTEISFSQSDHSVRDAPSLESINTALLPHHSSLHMNYPPVALLPGLQEAQRASCSHASVHPMVTSDVLSVLRTSVCVSLPHSKLARSLTFLRRTSPRPTLTSPMQMVLSYMLTTFYYATRFLGLHRIWFNVYRFILDARSSDLESAPTSRRSCWTETVQKMKRVWTIIIMASSLIITWVLKLLVTEWSWYFYSEPRLSVAFLQIDNNLNNVYPRTFSILAFVLSSASLAASCIFIANGECLDSIEKFRQWEIASHNQHALSSVDFWACLALPLTSLAWYTFTSFYVHQLLNNYQGPLAFV